MPDYIKGRGRPRKGGGFKPTNSGLMGGSFRAENRD